MKQLFLLGWTAALLLAPHEAWSQGRERKAEAAFATSKPAVGAPLPDVVLYDVQGGKVPTASLRGHYTVLTFGCLT